MSNRGSTSFCKKNINWWLTDVVVVSRSWRNTTLACRQLLSWDGELDLAVSYIATSSCIWSWASVNLRKFSIHPVLYCMVVSSNSGGEMCHSLAAKTLTVFTSSQITVLSDPAQVLCSGFLKLSFFFFTQNRCLVQTKMPLWEQWERSRTVTLWARQLNNKLKLIRKLGKV